MSESHSEKELEPFPVGSSPLIREKLSARRAKRAVKAAERRKRSDALKEEGNAFFYKGKFQDALERYQQAIDVHGPSIQPVLLANAAAAYLKLGMYFEAHEAADKALGADPTSVKARYRRGMARKHMKMWTAAGIDFRTLLTLEPENKQIEAELAFVEEMRCDSVYLDLAEEEDSDRYSEYESPGLEDDPQPGESLSESSDCEHTGNGIPCKFYNRTECKNGHACRFSHAPDKRSERDALGRNVCHYYLIGTCKFGERCSYLHSTEYLLQKGWWSTTKGVNAKKSQYKFAQMCNKAMVDYNNSIKGSGTGQTSKKKQPKGKKKRDYRSRSDSARGPTAAGQLQSASGGRHSSQMMDTKGKKRTSIYSSPSLEGYDSDGDEEDGMLGFTGSEVEELLCHGIKPWDDDARDFLDALYSY